MAVFIAIIYIGYSDEPPGSGIPKDVLLLLLIVLWVADIAFVYWIKKKLASRADSPIRITSQGVELSRNKILLATEISKVMIDVQGNIALFIPGKKLPAYTLSRQHLGNADEFIRVLKNQNPLLEIEDMREQNKKYQAERKAKKEARKGL